MKQTRENAASENDASSQSSVTSSAPQASRVSFTNSEKVYCFMYVKRVNDGITSKPSSPIYMFVNFQKDMVGFYVESRSIQTIQQNLLENPEYYNQKAIEDLVDSYNEWDSGPREWMASFGGTYDFTPRATIYKYQPKYSSSNKRTYQRYSKVAQPNSLWQGYHRGYRGTPTWGNTCYTFSYDGELIIWETNNVDDKKYYQMIDPSELQPNMDFLY